MKSPKNWLFFVEIFTDFYRNLREMINPRLLPGVAVFACIVLYFPKVSVIKKNWKFEKFWAGRQVRRLDPPPPESQADTD